MQEPGFDPWVGKIPWRRKWQPTPIFLPGESHGRRSLVGYSPWGGKESDTTERLHFHFSLSIFHCIFVVQSLSCVQLFVTPWTAARQAFLSFTISQSLLKLTSIELVMPSNHLILCNPLLLLPSIFPSIRVFSNESAIVYMYHNFFIHSSADGHLGCFHFLAIICIPTADFTLPYSRNQRNIVKQLASNLKKKKKEVTTSGMANVPVALLCC